MKQKYFYLLLTLSAFSVGLQARNPERRILELIEQVSREEKLDTRTVVYEPIIEKKGRRWVVGGSISDPQLAHRLRCKLDSAEIPVTDHIRLIPDTVVGEKCYGLISVSVGNMRRRGSYSSEMVSQALLGTPVRILDKPDWLRIQTPDNYIGYVTPGAIHRMTREEFEQWEKAPKIIYTGIYGFAYNAPDTSSPTVSDLVFGGILQQTGETTDFFEIRFPDGRKGFVNKDESELLSVWQLQCNAVPDNIIASAYQLMGIPYLWGGTSTKGMDCSGFIKTIALMNGKMLQRDASQQAYVGEPIAPGEDFEQLLPGDLLFFGRKATDTEKEKVIHVGLYLGNKQFIHAASRIRINSFDPASPDYDSYNTARFLWATRPFTATPLSYRP